VTILGALAEVVSVSAFLVIVLAGSYFVCQRTGLNDRFNRHVRSDLVVKRPTESPTELYLRRQRESANAWQEADR
jgi:hypothetical protein